MPDTTSSENPCAAEAKPAPSVAASAPSVAVSAPSAYKYDIGARLRCDWKENDQRDCEVIERRLVDGVPQYYIHYADFNRRLDEWVLDGRLHPPQPSAVRPGNERKRKLDPAVASCPTPLSHAADEAAAGELDAATQREHEAATRVKNINAIQLGKWQIQTWCVIDGCPSAQQRGRLLRCQSCDFFVTRAHELCCVAGTTPHSPKSMQTARRCTFASMTFTSPRNPRRYSAT